MRRRTNLIFILILISIIMIIFLCNRQARPITSYLHTSSHAIVKVSVFFEGRNREFYETVNSKDISNFIGYLNTCILKEKLIQIKKAGYTSNITIFYSDGLRDDLTISDTISISQKEYSIVKGDLSNVNIQNLLKLHD